MKTLKFRYDPMKDIVEIEGIRYTAAFFRDLASLHMVGNFFKVESNEKGVIALRKYRSPTEVIRDVVKEGGD